jgi:hypothetical protein
MSVNPLRQLFQLSDDSQSIADVLPLVLRRIVRLIIGTISYPALVDMLRSIYVEEGQKKLERKNSKPTKSALALITGMDTRVVSSVLAKDCSVNLKPQQLSPELALIDTWNSDPLFLDSSTGNPAVLPIEGKGRTFQGLVLRSIGRNITVKTVLDRLLQSKTIQIIEGDAHKGEADRVKILSLVYMPISSDRAKLTDIAFLESSRVLSTVIHNMNAEPEYRVPQQGRWTYRLSPDNYQEFRDRTRILLDKQIKEGEALLEEFEEAQRKPGQLTVGIGWYQWGGHESDKEGDN